jgi:hypothetical protein
MAKKATAVKKPANLPATTEPDFTNVPAHLRGMQTASESNMRQQDQIIPRIKLLQALSPEIEQYRDTARPGLFWHNVMNEPIGEDGGRTLDFICFRSRFFYLLFAPRNDPRVVLARANDGIHWVPASGSFEVKLKGAPNKITYKMAPTVEASGLAEFGSANQMHLGPVILSLARSQIKKGKLINTAHKQLGVAMTGLRFRDESIQEQGEEGPYFNHQFKRAGWASPEETAFAEQFAQQFKKADYRAAGEEDYREEASAGPKDVPKNAKGF